MCVDFLAPIIIIIAQMFDGLQMATHSQLTSKVTSFLLHLLEIVPQDPKVGHFAVFQHD